MKSYKQSFSFQSFLMIHSHEIKKEDKILMMTPSVCVQNIKQRELSGNDNGVLNVYGH